MKVYLIVLTLVIGLWAAIVFALQERILRPLQTASNMLSALREGDLSLQAGAVDENDPLGQVMMEINALTEVLRRNRLGALEASALLQKVVENIDVAVFTFDPQYKLQLANRAGEMLLAQPASSLAGNSAASLGLEKFLNMDTSRPVPHAFAGKSSRWLVKSSHYREGGQPHHLLLLSDLSKPLREEERMAWKRLIRVLGHELNNSLAPIKSLAGSMEKLLTLNPMPPDWRADMKDGLDVIAARADALSKFMGDYSRLAKLPPPRKRETLLEPLVNRVVSLSTQLEVIVSQGPPCTLQADPGQIEQILINLLKNAVDAVLPSQGKVRLSWFPKDRKVTIIVEDDGPGIANPNNLFIPFFSTKPNGSGIGLTLSRAIAEAHEGTLDLVNREDRSGCRAVLTLPL